MFRCSKCKRSKPEKEFSARPNGKPRGVCKKCVNKYSRAKYQEDPDRYADSRYKNKKKRRDALRDLVAKAKDKPCADCDNSYPKAVMEFDHRPGTKKVDAVANLVGSGRKAAVLLEIEKCDVVCANCHRIRTYGV